MTAKWTVLALLAAAPVFSQSTIQLTYDSFDATDSTLNPGLICSPAKVATATNSANGFSFPVNWSCWSGNATVTGSVTVSFSPATVTATKTGSWGTLNFSTPITMTATAVIAGTGITGASLTASTAYLSSKGLVEANPIAGCNQSSITGTGTVTLTCPVSTVQGWNDTVGLMPAFGIALNVVTTDRDGTAWGDGVQVYGKFKQCSGSSCPSDQIAFSRYVPDNDQPIMVGNQTQTPRFYARVVYDLESVQNGQVSLQLLAGTGNGPVTLVDRAGTQNVSHGLAVAGADGTLMIGPVPLPNVAVSSFTLRAILSDSSGHELASDLLHYQTLSVTMSLQLGCASGYGDQWGLADPSTFVADSSPSKVFYRVDGYPQTCSLSPGSGSDLAILVTYSSPVRGTLSASRVEIPAPDGDNRQFVVYPNMDGAEINMTESAIRSIHAPKSLGCGVSFRTDSGQIAVSKYVDIPLEFVVPWPPSSAPVPASPNISVSVSLDYNIIEPGLKLYRQVEAYPAPTEIPQSHTDTFTLAPNGKASTRVTYYLGPAPGSAVASGSTSVSMAPATVTIPPVTGATPATVSTPAESLSVQHNTANRSVATTELSQSIDNVKAAANVNTGNLPSPQFSMSAAPAADAGINGYIPIDSTYSFTPAIPQDGSFTAAITFQYSAADLPDDPNFVEASLQVISYDPATGVVTSYPTVLDTLNKKATAQITGLAPYYSLAVLGPFTKTTVSLPYLAPASGMSPLSSLVNWGATDASLQVGSPAVSATPGTTTLKAGAQLAQSAARWFGGADPSLQNSSAWLRVKSDQSTVAAAQLFSGMGLDFAAPLSAPAGTLVFPNVQSDDLFETAFTLVNPGTATTTVNLYLRGSDGTNVDSAVANIAGLGSWSGTASGAFAKLTQPFQGYVLVVSPQNLVGYEMLAGPTVVAALPALPLPAAVTGTAPLYSPNFTYGGGTGSTMHLSNPTAKDANLTIRLYDASGNALGQPLAKLLPAGQQAAIDVGAILGAPPTTAVTGSLVVQSTMPAIVGDLSTGDAWSFLTDRAALPLVSALSPNLILPYLANDGTNYTASVAVFNPNTSPAAVKISAFGPNGASAGSASFNVPANGRIAGALSTLVSAARGLAAGYVRIDANVPVVAAGFMQPAAGGDSAAMLALPTTGAAGSGGTTPAPKFAASTSSLDFGSVAVTQVSDKAVTLQNTGTAALNITSFTPPAAPFTLTAPATPFSIAAGASQTITVRFAPTAAGSQSGSVKISTNDSSASNFTLALTGQATAASTGAKPAINAAGVVNAASYNTPLARCSLASIFGTNLVNATAFAASVPLPTILGGAQVIVGGVPAPLVYVSPGQINFQVPCEMPLNGSVTMTVNNSGAASTAQSVTLAPYAPGVFTYARTSASTDPIIVHVDNLLVTPGNPAKAGEILVVWATGVGNLSQLPATGAASPSSPPATAVNLPTVTVGGAAVSVQFAGLTPGSVGLVQINIQLPSTLPAGSSLPLLVIFPGAPSPPVNLWVQSSSSGPVRGTVLVSDSFNRADAAACSLGRADLASGGSGSHYYLPIYTTATTGVGIVSKALQNLGLDYAGVQLTATSGCGGARGETIAQDLDIAVDLLVPASSAGVVQAGPYFRARSAAPGDGIVGAAGYWVALTSTGEVAIRGLSPNAVIATTGSPASFDATRFHTLEMVAQGASLTVYLDNNRLTFTQNNASVTTVALPATTGSNDGAVGIVFADEANRGKAGGQRAQNLIVAQPGSTPR
jgi:uncharacterized protein (TIGR03437 family)